MGTRFFWEFNWSGDGLTWVDESRYVQSWQSFRGARGAILPGFMRAESGWLRLVVDNSKRRFSPDYASGPLYGSLVSGRKFRLRVLAGGVSYIEWAGRIARFVPDTVPEDESGNMAAIVCEDILGRLAGGTVTLPLQTNKRADQLIRDLVDEALGAQEASGYVSLDGIPANNDTVAISSASRTLKSALTPLAGEVLIGPRRDDTAYNLIMSWIGGPGGGVLYGTGAAPVSDVELEFFPELPNRATVWAIDGIPVVGTGFAPVVSAGLPYCGYGDLFPRAVGTACSWSVFLQPGSYTFSVLGFKGPNLGKVDWALDGVTFLAGQDWYDASYITVTQTGSVSISLAGHHVLKVTISGKNLSSSDYVSGLVKAWFRQGVD